MQQQDDETITVPAEDITVELSTEELEAILEARRAEDAAAAAAADPSATSETPEILEGAAEDVAELQDELIAETEELAEEGSALADLLDVELLQVWGTRALTWIRTDVLTINALLQLGLVFGALIPAVLFGPRLKGFIGRYLRKQVPAGILRRLADAAAVLATPIALWITLTVFMWILRSMGEHYGFVSAAQSLLAAWIIVRVVTLAIRSPFWSKVAFYIAWPIAALDAFGVLGDVFDWMEARAYTLTPAGPGQEAQTISLYDVLRAGLIFALFLLAANFVTGLLISRVNQTEELNVSFKALLAKVLNFVLPIAALIAALAFIGFDLTYLAVFGGAAALGIGLGLQKIIGNFLAGFTLLADRSIKPGDTIQVGDTFGWITDMKSRYVSIRTRDGTEHLIPNATFMDEGVINWSHNDRAVRCKADVGVAYGTESLRQVQKICLEAAKTTPRVLDRPPPVCNLIGFGASSVDFSLRFWINDPPNGIANVRSEVLIKVWEGLKEAGIEIPFPQRDLHIKSSDVAFDAGFQEAAE
ncbi:mechanosensitive ion channel family protein [Parvularcula oceani]|uniref:mechanosensitive ion channel family protein n=1 Tax=Parvularcula oceani TaxID=1247963 RepID=UPI000ADB2F36|nr:mechanosensitive ion channel domain-containing protein [Parvularcula oceani]